MPSTIFSISNNEPKSLFLRSFVYCLRALSTSQNLFLFFFCISGNQTMCHVHARPTLYYWAVSIPLQVFESGVSVEIRVKMGPSLYSALPERHLVFTQLKGNFLPVHCLGEWPAVGAWRTIHQGPFVKSLCVLFSNLSSALLAYIWGQNCNHSYKQNQPIHFVITVKAHHQPNPT